MKVFTIEFEVSGREVYVVDAETEDEAREYILDNFPAPDNTEVAWEDDGKVINEEDI